MRVHGIVMLYSMASVRRGSNAATVRRTAGVALAALLAVIAQGSVLAASNACGGAAGGGHAGGEFGAIGVVDVLTEFASVCVNGLEIQYDENTPVTINGRPATTKQLAPGQVVAVETRAGAGQLAAEKIAVMRVLEGPATGVDASTQTVFVMGRPV